MDAITRGGVSKRVEQLRRHLTEIRDGAALLAGSGIDAGEAQSIADLRARADAALDNIGQLAAAVAEGGTAGARRLARQLRDHVGMEIADGRLVEDLEAAVAEAEAELAGRAGPAGKPHKAFVRVGRKVVRTIVKAASGASGLSDLLQEWKPESDRKEVVMAEQSEVEDAIREVGLEVGRQLSFLGTNVAAAAAPGGTPSAGSYPNVSAQLMASLDGLTLPHHGVQFATAGTMDAARGDLIEGLLDAFHGEMRDGNLIFVPGPSRERRAVAEASSQIQLGAARVRGRMVRAEADNILDILDRLPDMTRFLTRQGVPSAREARTTVADRFVDLDEVMLDPMGVNVPRATFALRRIAKAILDFFDYANLERELYDELVRCGGDRYVARSIPRPPKDVDETGLRRPVVQSEELRREIAEVAESFVRLADRVLSPTSDTLGVTASRLEQSLTVVHGSALGLRDIMVRSGSSLPEQDVQLFAAGIRIEVESRGAAPRLRGAAMILSTGQVLDWILEVSEPYVAAGSRSAYLEQEDFAILADELDDQIAAIDRLHRECSRLGFAFRIPGPMRQLGELRFHIEAAARLARDLTDSARRPAEREGARP